MQATSTRAIIMSSATTPRLVPRALPTTPTSYALPINSAFVSARLPTSRKKAFLFRRPGLQPRRNSFKTDGVLAFFFWRIFPHPVQPCRLHSPWTSCKFFPLLLLPSTVELLAPLCLPSEP